MYDKLYSIFEHFNLNILRLTFSSSVSNLRALSPNFMIFSPYNYVYSIINYVIMLYTFKL